MSSLNFVPVRLAPGVQSMSATSATTGLRYLVKCEGVLWSLLIEGLDGAPANDRDRLALTFESEKAAVDYADRADLGHSLALQERVALPCTLVIQPSVVAEAAVERYFPDHFNAYASARETILKEYRNWLPSRRALWWTDRAVKILKVYGRVETPDVVLTIEVPTLDGGAAL